MASQFHGFIPTLTRESLPECRQYLSELASRCLKSHPTSSRASSLVGPEIDQAISGFLSCLLHITDLDAKDQRLSATAKKLEALIATPARTTNNDGCTGSGEPDSVLEISLNIITWRRQALLHLKKPYAKGFYQSLEDTEIRLMKAMKWMEFTESLMKRGAEEIGTFVEWATGCGTACEFVEDTELFKVSLKVADIVIKGAHEAKDEGLNDVEESVLVEDRLTNTLPGLQVQAFWDAEEIKTMDERLKWAEKTQHSDHKQRKFWRDKKEKLENRSRDRAARVKQLEEQGEQ